ncbi:hypothetical protein CCR97_11465 [Rhodoplanes elegans]|uniref:Uncharacterized protein n=1 Tax=Rhodoplanes elegans TaxID=29408 RepID=A0A327KT59_9BRAD|nr:hypothetical protein [Rhodoplanes elegans]MBK5958822.1 hypothetical protein [Rhodoplanes elegans]RAI41477.1 hypothetical protein CH338_02910 [Rhodoplanes elegans]
MRFLTVGLSSVVAFVVTFADGSARAQGVNERMITGAPPSGSTTIIVPGPEPRRPTAVPTGPPPQVYAPLGTYPPPPYDYGQRRARPKIIDRRR